MPAAATSRRCADHAARRLPVDCVRNRAESASPGLRMGPSAEHIAASPRRQRCDRTGRAAARAHGRAPAPERREHMAVPPRREDASRMRGARGARDRRAGLLRDGLGYGRAKARAMRRARAARAADAGAIGCGIRRGVLYVEGCRATLEAGDARNRPMAPWQWRW
jgi:hypothetical protein